MAIHWTYEGLSDSASDLEQGDILRPTEDLRKLFSEVHPHFCDDKYTGFMVATQSCDLVRRKGSPKALYVSLAVIRPIAQLLPKLIGQVAKPIAAGGVFPASARAEARLLLARIFNQNEQALGLFFLHADADSGIGEQSVSMLRVTVAVRSQHYSVLTSARAGRLNAEFRAKLGWLLGNLYARPATKDWSDMPGGRAEIDRLTKEFLKEQIPGLGPCWVDDEIVDEATKKGVEIAGKSHAELESLRPRSIYEVAAELVRQEVSRVAPNVTADDLDKIQNGLKNSARFTKLFKTKSS